LMQMNRHTSFTGLLGFVQRKEIHRILKRNKSIRESFKICRMVFSGGLGFSLGFRFSGTVLGLPAVEKRIPSRLATFCVTAQFMTATRQTGARRLAASWQSSHGLQQTAAA
jgi:hypothetical protein